MNTHSTVLADGTTLEVTGVEFDRSTAFGDVATYAGFDRLVIADKFLFTSREELLEIVPSPWRGAIINWLDEVATEQMREFDRTRADLRRHFLTR